MTDMSISDPNTVPVTFVNQIASHGCINGVVNFTFATALFTPSNDNKTVDADLIVTCRLRMDLYCAMQLRRVLDRIIEQNTTKPPEKTVTAGLVN
jgi:hypothetical protein